MARLGGGVLRIGVDDHQPRLERTEGGDGVLQRVGQLQRQAVTGLQPRMMAQVPGEGVGLPGQVGVAEAVIATGECRAVRVLGAGQGQEVMDVLIAATGQFGGHVALHGSGHQHSPK